MGHCSERVGRSCSAPILPIAQAMPCPCKVMLSSLHSAARPCKQLLAWTAPGPCKCPSPGKATEKWGRAYLRAAPAAAPLACSLLARAATNAVVAGGKSRQKDDTCARSLFLLPLPPTPLPLPRSLVPFFSRQARRAPRATLPSTNACARRAASSRLSTPSFWGRLSTGDAAKGAWSCCPCFLVSAPLLSARACSALLRLSVPLLVLLLYLRAPLSPHRSLSDERLGRGMLQAARAAADGEYACMLVCLWFLWPLTLRLRCPRLCRHATSFVVYFRHMWAMLHVWTHLHYIGFSAAVVSVLVYLQVQVVLLALVGSWACGACGTRTCSRHAQCMSYHLRPQASRLAAARAWWSLSSA